MKHYHLTTVSKTKESLEAFFTFLNDTSSNFNTIKKYFKKKKKKKVLTILKSPHVYKTAQEQFESNFFSSQLTIYSNNNFQSLILLKKIKNNLFPDIKIKVQFPINRKLLKKTQTHILNPNHFILNFLQKHKNQKKNSKNFQKKRYKQIKHLLQIFDVYGELAKNKFR